MDASQIVLTAEGRQKLVEELAWREGDYAKEIVEDIKEARAFGDLSENSEYDDAKEAQAKNEARIQELVALLKNATVLDEDDLSTTKVSLGSTIVLRDEETKEEIEYYLVNANEEDIFNRRLSIDSPIGQSVIGKKKGQVVDVQTPMGSLKYKIIKIGK